MKANEQSLIQAKPIFAEVTRLTIDIGKMCDRGWYHTSEHSTRYLDMADGGQVHSLTSVCAHFTWIKRGLYFSIMFAEIRVLS